MVRLTSYGATTEPGVQHVQWKLGQNLCMTVPDWKTAPIGTRSRVALWLTAEVGSDGVFTKAQLRDAFPHVEQIDRRMRDLRKEGWVITTYREDRTLEADELRLVKRGGNVWERGYRSQQTSVLPDKVRNATLSADGFRCVQCGVGAGDAYADDLHHRAQLSVVRASSDSDGQAGRQLTTLCDRCRRGAADSDARSGEQLLGKLSGLDADQLLRFKGWVRHDVRQEDLESALWALYRQLPAEQRADVRRELDRG